jgi:hypothetical protein
MSNGQKSFQRESDMGHPEDGWMSKARSDWIAGKGWEYRTDKSQSSPDEVILFEARLDQS